MSNKTFNDNFDACKKHLHMAEYIVTESKYEYCGKKCLSYGIDVYLYDDSANKKLIISISDISADKERIVTLADNCNRLEVSPDHIYDIIDDFLM